MSRIHITIDRLAFSGLDRGQREAFIRGLKAELLHTMAGVTSRSPRAATWRSQRTSVLKLGKVALDPGTTGARNLGVRVARGIAGRVKP